MARDVEWIAHKGRFNFKALTDKAREVMGKDMGGPWQMAADVFFYGVTPEKFEQVIGRLRANGLNCDPEPKEQFDVSKFTDF